MDFNPHYLSTSERKEETMEFDIGGDFNFGFLMDPFSVDSGSQPASDDVFNFTASLTSEPLTFAEEPALMLQPPATTCLSSTQMSFSAAVAAAIPLTSLASGAVLELRCGPEVALSTLLDLQARLSQEILGTTSNLTKAAGQTRLLRRKLRGINKKLNTVCPKKSKRE